MEALRELRHCGPAVAKESGSDWVEREQWTPGYREEDTPRQRVPKQAPRKLC